MGVQVSLQSKQVLEYGVPEHVVVVVANSTHPAPITAARAMSTFLTPDAAHEDVELAALAEAVYERLLRFSQVEPARGSSGEPLVTGSPVGLLMEPPL